MGAQNVQISPPRDQIICSSSAVNVTYNCTADSGSVIWQLGEYQVVDRDQFMNSGVMVHVQTDELTYLTLGMEGREFLREEFDSDTISVRCFTAIDNFNLYFTERYMVKVYGKLYGQYCSVLMHDRHSPYIHHTHCVHMHCRVAQICSPPAYMHAGFVAGVCVCGVCVCGVCVCVCVCGVCYVCDVCVIQSMSGVFLR